MRKLAMLGAATSLLLFGSQPLWADTVDQFSAADATTLTLVNVPPPGNQPQNIQCIICGTHQPQQDLTFGYNNYKQGGNITDFKAFSTADLGGVQLDNDQLGTGYAVSFLSNFLNQTQLTLHLDIGIDVNTATGQGPENLLRFAVIDLTTLSVLAQYVGPTPLPTNNNGSGFPDYLLTGFTLDGINAGDNLIFFARWSNTSDGAESFFIVPRLEAVPGPIAGAGLPGLIAACGGLWGFNRFRRRRQAA